MDRVDAICLLLDGQDRKTPYRRLKLDADRLAIEWMVSPNASEEQRAAGEAWHGQCMADQQSLIEY